jgi:hypothetical protein
MQQLKELEQFSKVYKTHKENQKGNTRQTENR